MNTPVLPDDHSEREPPDPIPNSEVKPFSADGSVGLPHARVSRRQVLDRKARTNAKSTGFFLAFWGRCLGRLENSHCYVGNARVNNRRPTRKKSIATAPTPAYLSPSSFVLCFLLETRKALLDHLVKMHDQYILDWPDDSSLSKVDPWQRIDEKNDWNPG